MRSNQLSNAVGLLKEEMRQLDSLIMKAADQTAVPAGGALAVDRDRFSTVVTETLKQLPNVHIHEEEITEIPKEGIVVIATGPLTSDTLAEQIKSFCGTDSLHFLMLQLQSWQQALLIKILFIKNLDMIKVKQHI